MDYDDLNGECTGEREVRIGDEGVTSDDFFSFLFVSFRLFSSYKKVLWDRWEFQDRRDFGGIMSSEDFQIGRIFLGR
jgi:hypothetical protein